MHPSNQEVKSSGLIYDNEVLSDLVNRDTDGDGVLDWEESLWGTDPKKKETTPGIPDDVAIEKLKKQNGQVAQAQNGNLNQTDKFSQELFATVTALNQTGAMDQVTVDKLSNSLATQIKNSAPKKVFVISELKIINTENKQTFQNYANTLGGTFKKYAVSVDITSILAQSMTKDGDIDTQVLNKLDPIIKNISAIVDAMAGMDVPVSLSAVHLNTLNGFEKFRENLSDIKLVDSDPVLSISAISQFQTNDDQLRTSLDKLKSAVTQKLNN